MTAERKNKELWYVECRKVSKGSEMPAEWLRLDVGPQGGGWEKQEDAATWKQEAERSEQLKDGPLYCFKIEYRIISSLFLNNPEKWTVEFLTPEGRWKSINKSFIFQKDAEEYRDALNFFNRNAFVFRTVKYRIAPENVADITVRDFFAEKTQWSLQKIYAEHQPALESEQLKLAYREKLPKTYWDWLNAPAFIIFSAERYLRQRAELENAKKKELEKIYAIQYRIPEFSGKDGKWSFCAVLKAGKVRHYHYSSKLEAVQQVTQFLENLKEFANPPGIEYRVVSKPKKSHRKFLPEQ